MGRKDRQIQEKHGCTVDDGGPSKEACVYFSADYIKKAEASKSEGIHRMRQLLPQKQPRPTGDCSNP